MAESYDQFADSFLDGKRKWHYSKIQVD